MEFWNTFISEFLVEGILTISIGVLTFSFRKFAKKQKQIDEEQDKKNQERAEQQKRRDEEQDRRMQEWRAEFERRLRSRDIRLDYFEKQRLTAYKQIRKFAQRARDEARLIQTPTLIKDYASWKQDLFENYAEVLELLHEHALLLEYFNHYEYVHEFKNALLIFCLSAQKLNPLNEEDRTLLNEEYQKFSKSWESLAEQIKFPQENVGYPIHIS